MGLRLWFSEKCCDEKKYIELKLLHDNSLAEYNL